MVHWALNWEVMRNFLHCRKILDTNLVSHLYILPDLPEVILDLHCYKGPISFCRMVFLLICSIFGIAGCLERSYFISQYPIFNILIEVPNLSSSCQKLIPPIINFLWVIPLNSPYSPTLEKIPTFIAEETARLSSLVFSGRFFLGFFLLVFHACLLNTFSQRISELLRLEGLSGGHLVQPFCWSSITRAGCSGLCPLRSWRAPRSETPQLLLAACVCVQQHWQ